VAAAIIGLRFPPCLLYLPRDGFYTQNRTRRGRPWSSPSIRRGARCERWQRHRPGEACSISQTELLEVPKNLPPHVDEGDFSHTGCAPFGSHLLTACFMVRPRSVGNHRLPRGRHFQCRYSF
jgi:hypothetical protein